MADKHKKARRQSKQNIRDVLTASNQANTNIRGALSSDASYSRRIVRRGNQPIVSVQSELHAALRSVVDLQLSGMSKQIIDEELEHAARVSLRKTFKELDVTGVEELIQSNVKAESTTKMFSKLKSLAEEHNKKSLIPTLGRQIRMIGKRDISNLVTMPSGIKPTATAPLKEGFETRHNFTQAKAWHTKLQQDVKQFGGRINLGGYRVLNVGGAPVVDFEFSKPGIKATSNVRVPLGNRVPTGELNHFIYGQVQTLARRDIGLGPQTFGDFIVDDLIKKGGLLDQWDQKKTHLALTGSQNLKNYISSYQNMFPNVMPAPAGTGIQNAQELRYGSTVNVEMAQGEQVEATMRGLAKKGFTPSSKSELVRPYGRGGREYVQMMKDFDLTDRVPFGNLADWGRKPWNFMRSELFWSAESAELARTYEKQKGIKGLYTKTALNEMSDRRTMNVLTAYAPSVRTGPGEAIVSSKVADIMELEQYKHYKIEATEGISRVASEVIEAEKTGRPVRIASGKTLGMGFETLKEVGSKTTGYGSGGAMDIIVAGALGGDPESARALGENITEEIASVKRTEDGKYLQVVTRRLIKGHTGLKVFEDLKHTLITKGYDEFTMMAEEAGFNKKAMAMEADLLVSSDMIFKDPRLRMKQMTTALQHTLEQRGVAGDFVSDPLGYLKGAEGPYGTQKRLLGVAQQYGIAGEEFGSIFGSYYQDQDAIKAIGFNKAQQSAIKASGGRFLGVSAMVPGGSELAGELGAGTFEQRALWKMEAMGGHGSAISEMMASRRMTQGSAGIREIEKAWAPMMGRMDVFAPEEIAGAKDLTRGFLSPGRIGNIYGQEGTLLKVSDKYKGIFAGGHVYLPSQTDLHTMSPYINQMTGEATAATTLKRYEDVLGLMTEDADIGKVERSAQNLRIDLAENYAKAIAGKQRIRGALRGQAQSATSNANIARALEQRGRFAVGISQEAMDRMWSEMLASGMDKATVRAQQTAAREGQGVAGMLWRHPQTGAYSSMPAEFHIMPDIGGAGSHLYLQEGIAKAARGDFDADRFGVALVNSRREDETMRKMLSSQNFEADFVAYQEKSELFSAAKKSGRSVSALADYDQLASVTKHMLAEEISGVDYAMEQLVKGAVASGDKKLIADAMMIYEHVPQELISAKHLSPGEVKGLVGISQRLMTAVSEKNVGGVESILGQTFDINRLNKGILSRDFADVIGDSAKYIDQVKESDMHTLMEVARGKGTLGELSDPSEILRVIQEGKKGMYGRLMPGEDSLLTGEMFESKTMKTGSMEAALSNIKTKSKSAFAGAGKSKAMLAAGAAVGGAMLYFAGREQSSIGAYPTMIPPSESPAHSKTRQPLVTPDFNFNAKPKFISPESIKGGNVSSMPSTPQGIQHQNSARVTTDHTPLSHIINIRGTDKANVDYNELAAKIRARMKLPSSVNTNINDNTTTLTPDKVDRLVGGLY